MKVYLIIVGILCVFSVASFLQQKGTIEEAMFELEKSNNTIQVLKERFIFLPT